MPICRFFQVAVSALRSCAPFFEPHRIFQSLRASAAAAARAAPGAAEVVYVENVLLGNYLESLGREASQDRGNPSKDRTAAAAVAFSGQTVSNLLHVSQSETWRWFVRKLDVAISWL